MHQIEVDVVGAQILEGCIESTLDVIRVVLVVPQLGHQEDLFTRNTRLLDGRANSRLSAINTSGVNVPVTSLKSSQNCWFLGILVLPSSEA